SPRRLPTASPVDREAAPYVPSARHRACAEAFRSPASTSQSTPRRSTPSRENASDRLQRAPLALRFEAAQPVQRGSSHALQQGRRGENQSSLSPPKGITSARICKQNPHPAAVG